MKIQFTCFLFLVFPLALLCQTDKYKPKSKELKSDKWEGWAFDIGLDFRLRKSLFGTREEVEEYEGTARVFASKKMNQSLLNFWASYDHYQRDERFPVRKAGTFRSEIQFIFPISQKWSFTGSTLFETQERLSDFYDILNYRTFGALKPGIEYSFIPKADKSKMNMIGIYSIGPHYIYRGTTLDFTAFHSLELDAYYKTYNLTFSLRAAAFQNLKAFDESNFYLNPNVSAIFLSAISVNVGVHFHYYDKTISDLAYFLRVRFIDIDEYSDYGIVYTPYVGMNYHFGSKDNVFYNVRF